MPTPAFAPFTAAVARLDSKSPVASLLTSAEWAKVPLALRERAFFSARINDAKTVQTMQDAIRQALTLEGETFMDKAKFMATVRNAIGAEEGDTGDLQDIASRRRLELVYDFQTTQAAEAGAWLAGNAPEQLDAFPAQELVRIESREEERDWGMRWADAGGTFYGRRMVALKNDPVWVAISAFQTPYPPFDFGSGMGMRDLSRAEAEEMGLLAPGDPTPPSPEIDFNKDLKASVPPESLAGLKAQFGDQIDTDREGKVVWQGERIRRLYETALTNPNAKWDLALGDATPAAVQIRPELAGARLVVKASNLKHIHENHMVEEPDGSQRPVTAAELQLIPHVWREPDQIVAGKEPGTLEFRANLAGWKVLVVYNRAVDAGAAPGAAWAPKTFWAKREGVKP